MKTKTSAKASVQKSKPSSKAKAPAAKLASSLKGALKDMTKGLLSKSAKPAPAKGAKAAAPAAASKAPAKGAPAKAAPAPKAAPVKAAAPVKGGKAAAAPAPVAAAPAKGKTAKAGTAVKVAKAPRISADDMCREVACESLMTSGGYCRLHYIKNWKKIKRKEVILKEGKLNQYIEELIAKYPDKYIEAIRQDLADDKAFAKVIYDLDLDESVDDFEAEGENLDAVIDGIKRDFDDEGETF
jgi:uncharacterized protein YihD (DUF1040 family)